MNNDRALYARVRPLISILHSNQSSSRRAPASSTWKEQRRFDDVQGMLPLRCGKVTVLEGETMLTLYQWNTHRAKHYFCRRCGIYVFHRKRAAPDHFGVNVFCLENIEVASMPIRATEGANMTIEDPIARPEWPGPRGA